MDVASSRVPLRIGRRDATDADAMNGPATARIHLPDAVVGCHRRHRKLNVLEASLDGGDLREFCSAVFTPFKSHREKKNTLDLESRLLETLTRKRTLDSIKKLKSKGNPLKLRGLVSDLDIFLPNGTMCIMT